MGPQVNKFEQATFRMVHDLVDRLTDTTENITFPQTTHAAGDSIVVLTTLMISSVQSVQVTVTPRRKYLFK